MRALQRRAHGSVANRKKKKTNKTNGVHPTPPKSLNFLSSCRRARPPAPLPSQKIPSPMLFFRPISVRRLSLLAAGRRTRYPPSGRPGVDARAPRGDARAGRAPPSRARAAPPRRPADPSGGLPLPLGGSPGGLRLRGGQGQRPGLGRTKPRRRAVGARGRGRRSSGAPAGRECGDWRARGGRRRFRARQRRGGCGAFGTEGDREAGEEKGSLARVPGEQEFVSAGMS